MRNAFALEAFAGVSLQGTVMIRRSALFSFVAAVALSLAFEARGLEPNRPPQLDIIANQQLAVPETRVFDATAHDPDSADVLVYSLMGLWGPDGTQQPLSALG